MSDDLHNGEYPMSGAITIAKLIPYLFAIAAFGYAVWTSAVEFSALQQKEQYQSDQILSLQKTQADNQAFDITVSTQLAMIQQNLSDLKASIDGSHVLSANKP